MKKLMHEQNRLWDYEILKQLGKGEYGQVFQVRLKKDGKNYALKKINISGQKQKIQAFREIKALKLLSHPDIIEYHDSFLSMDNIYIVTEFAEKGDLTVEIKNRIKKEKKYTQDELWDVFQQLVGAIKHLHEKHIVHRDIKLQNIFVTASGKYKLGDLGMSKMMHQNSHLLSTRVGTPIYFAPEIIQHKFYTFPVDIWALGCVFYYLAMLEHPYKDASIQTLGYYIVDKQPRPIKGAYSPQLINFINSLFDKNPQTRPTIHDIFKKLKERKQQKIGNKVSIFNLKHILSLKAQHFEQVAKKQEKIKDQTFGQQIMSPISPHMKYSNRFMQNSSLKKDENPQRKSIEDKMQKRNLSLILPKATKSTVKSSQKSYQQCTSPMIKSNGFSINIGSPQKNKPMNAFKLMNTQTVRYGNKLGSNNYSFSLHQSPQKSSEVRYPRKVRARVQIQ